MRAILEAAAHVFETHGYTETTTDMVAERAGVSIGSLYQYFPNKDALLVGLFEQHLEEAHAEMTDLARMLADPALTVEALARDLVARLFALHRECPRLHRILLEEAPLPERLLTAYAATQARLTTALAGRLDGAVADAELTAQMAIHLLEAMAHRYTLYPPPERSAAELEAGTAAMLTAFLERGT